MKTFKCVVAFIATYCFLYVVVAGFFACVTPVTFVEITSHPGYGVIASIPYLFVAGFVVDDLWQSLNT